MAVEHHIRKTPVDRLLSVQLGAFDQQAEGAMKIALRTSQLVAYETRATNVVDPLGGSYYVESLTDELEKKAWDLIKTILALVREAAGKGENVMGPIIEALRARATEGEVIGTLKREYGEHQPETAF